MDGAEEALRRDESGRSDRPTVRKAMEALREGDARLGGGDGSRTSQAVRPGQGTAQGQPLVPENQDPLGVNKGANWRNGGRGPNLRLNNDALWPSTRTAGRNPPSARARRRGPEVERDYLRVCFWTGSDTLVAV